MSDFVLEISGLGRTIALRPKGTIDFGAAQTLVNAVESVQAGSRTALLEIDLEHITGCTPEAQALLSSRAIRLPDLDALAGTG
jgi:hypothetical protein